jgi:phage terminase large subunit-like protein
LPNTSDFTTETILAIEPDGVEEVFDVQIERTENFIANGVVSHNTRWHEDDLAGRLLDQPVEDESLRWHVVKLPALAEGDDPPDYPVERAHGDPLCPELHPLSQLKEFERTMGNSFAALYQQRPTAAEGDVWKRAWFTEDQTPESKIRMVPRFPSGYRRTQVWDTALDKKERNDFNAMVEGFMTDEGIIYCAAMVNERMDFPELTKRMRQEYDRIGGGDLCVEDKASGKPARQQLRLSNVPVIEIPAGTDDKVARAKSVTNYAEAGQL